MTEKKKDNLAAEYLGTIFDLGISPEYNIGEVSLASLYRQVGWQQINGERSERFPESRVNKESVFFFEFNSTNSEKNLLDANDWKDLVMKSLSTPKMPKQAQSKLPILYPFVPDCTLYSSASRLKGNPWNPGNLIERVIRYGCTSEQEAESLWDQIFTALSSSPDDPKEDVYARIVSQEFSTRRPEDVRWSRNRLQPFSYSFDESVFINAPARKFVKDLVNVISLKNKLSRRQWLSIFESLLRIGCASHLLWVCNLNSQLWKYLKGRYNGKGHNDLNLELHLENDCHQFWKIEEKISAIKLQIESYARSQMAINFVLKKLSLNADIPKLDSIKSLETIGDKLQVFSQESTWSDLMSEIETTYNLEPKLLSCKKGFTKSISEFIEYSLRQKQTAEHHKRNFDQSYWIRKKASYKSAPWIIDLGPTSALTMIYCCSYGYQESRTIYDFLDQLRQYGFILEEKDLNQSNLMSLLNTLQVVSDSPDAEGGMIIKNPFKEL